jgi:hypothetical protein
MKGLPRFRSKSGQVNEPEIPEINGKWMFEVHFSIIGDGMPEKVYQIPEFFDTQEEAIARSRVVIREMSDLVVREAYGAEPDGEYFDLNLREHRKWDEN